MTPAHYVLLMFICLAAVTLAGLLWKLRSRVSSDASGVAEPIEEFDPGFYAPLQNALSEEDFAFLRSQPGYTTDLERELRRERKAVCREYLRYLAHDFSRIATAAKVEMLRAEDDRTLNFWALMRLQAEFRVSLAAARFRLAVYPALSSGWDFSLPLSRFERLYASAVRLPLPSTE